MFSIRYESGMWVIRHDGRLWTNWSWKTEWEALEYLSETEPDAAEELYRIHTSME